ncbi:MAG: hypothetical protein RL538_163 [Candidatus Parcubacteria bacterium]|jgi:hypothetical protein
MNKVLQHITRYTPFLGGVLVLLVILIPHSAHAGGLVDGVKAVYGAVTDPLLTFQKILFWLVVSVGGMLVYTSGFLMNATINHFVIGFGSTFLNSGIGVAVDQTWVIIRDFVNLFFIFGLVYIGLKMILDSDNSNTRRWLGHLVIAALLVNFSLFITKVVVDFSNQLSAEILAGAQMVTPTGKGGTYESDIAGALMMHMGITSVFKGSLPDGAGFGYIFGMLILFMVTAFVFASGAILLMIRFAVLNLYLVLSPVMFLGWVIAPLGDTMSRYWNDFLKRCFFAPIYFLFIYFSFQIIGGLQVAIKTTGDGANATNLANPNWAATFNADPSTPVADATTGTLPFFVLICIFMFLSLVAADKLGAEGAGKAVAIGKRWGTKTAKWTGAQTGGRLARRASYEAGKAANRGLRSLQQIDPAAGSNKFTRALRTGAQKAARSNAVQSTVGAGTEAMQKTKFGMARTRSEEAKLRNQTETNANNAMDVTKGLRAKELLDAVESGKIRVNNHGIIQEEELHNMTDERKAELGLTDLTSSDIATRDKAREEHQKLVEKMQRTAADLSTKDFEAMTSEQQIAVAEFLSGSQTDGVMKSDNISDAQKEKISNAQKEAVTKLITQNGEILSEKLSDLSIRQIEILGDQFVTDNAHLFTDSQFGEIKKSKKFTEGQVGRYIGNRKAKQEELIRTNPDSIFRLGTGTASNITTRQTETVYGKSRKVADIAKMSGAVLASPNAVPYLTVDALKAIASGDKEFERVSTQQRETILNNLEAQLQAPGPLNPNVAKALHYLHSPKGQEDFIGN